MGLHAKARRCKETPPDLQGEGIRDRMRAHEVQNCADDAYMMEIGSYTDEMTSYKGAEASYTDEIASYMEEIES
jgi:hypothetical protein